MASDITGCHPVHKRSDMGTLHCGCGDGHDLLAEWCLETKWRLRKCRDSPILATPSHHKRFRPPPRGKPPSRRCCPSPAPVPTHHSAQARANRTTTMRPFCSILGSLLSRLNLHLIRNLNLCVLCCYWSYSNCERPRMRQDYRPKIHSLKSARSA